jgi:signal transduction histidine kinase
MSVHAAIAPAATVRSNRAPVGRMIVVTVVYLAIVIAAAVYPFVSPLGEVWNAPLQPLEKADDVLVAVLWLAVLLTSLARQPNGRLWKLIFLAMVMFRIGAIEYVPNSLAWTVARIAEQLGVGVFVHLLLAFPTGALRDRFDRVVVAFAYALGVSWALNEALFVGDWFHIGCDPDCVQNVLVLWPDAELYNSLRNLIAAAFSLIVLPLVIVGLWRHWRAAAPAARRTLLPLIVGVPLWLAVSVVEILSRELDFGPGIAFFDSPSGRAIHLIAPLVLPVGLLLGLLRARWSRGRVASLLVELGRGVPVGGLRDVLARTLGDPSLQLAFAAPTGSGFVDASGQPVELPVDDPSRTITRLEREDELLGVLVHDPAIEAEDPGLVEAVGNAARMALENERLAAEVRAQLEEVRASRTRIVEAADAERRRVERDLHDGAQQRLVALALRLEVAKKTTPAASALLDEATGELQSAIGEVRGLARGIHPTILTEAGLRAAVDALAERTPVAVSVHIPERRFDPQVEATAYFVVAEALTNVSRHASATEVRVSAGEEGSRLVVTIADDGVGGADATAGSGLRGLADRLAAVDGTLTISSPPGGGTTIRAELPLDAHGLPASQADPTTGPSALARVRAVPEVRTEPRPRRRLRLSSPPVLIAVIAAFLAVVAVAAAVPTMQPRAADNGRADAFVRPFVYQVTSGSDIRLYSKSDHLQVLSAPPGDIQGISIWAVEDVLADRCDWHDDSRLVPRQPGVEGLLSYIRSVDGVHVQDLGRVVVDGRPALRVDLWMESASPGGCPGPPAPSSIFLWRDEQGTEIQVGSQGHVPLTVLDVDGETIAIEIWSGGDVDAWLPAAEKIVESIRFIYRPPVDASPASSTPTR